MGGASPASRPVDLAACLWERQLEIERATISRLRGVTDPALLNDPEYAGRLRSAVSAGVRYGILGLEGREEDPPPPPPELLSQARYAARNQVDLDTVLRRFFAGYALLANFLVEEAGRSEHPRDAGLQRALRTLAVLFDGLIVAVTDAYKREREERTRSFERRYEERVRRLLAGEPLDPAALKYDFTGWHLGAIASAPRASTALRDLAAGLDSRLLLCRLSEGPIWAWLGRRERLSAREVERLAIRILPPEVIFTLGEPGRDMEGWRLTHRQAKVAMPIALRGSERVVRYTDVAMLASAVSDELLSGFLRETYLAPLEAERDGGLALRRTLSAYLAAGRNASSAAAALKVSRKTVSIRLQTVEKRIGRPIDDCIGELDTALRLGELQSSEVPDLASAG